MTGALILLAPGTTENAAANGDTRTIHLHHAHTQENIDATFMVDGQYDPGVLQKLNWFLRDWRHDEATKMDPRLFDTIWEVYRESGSQQPIVVMSAYRSPETNAMLRRRSRAVAEHSQHILGKAMDQHYVDVPASRIREIAMRLQRGGVGFYPTAGSPFVHMDVGGVRHWPRMSYDQLSRLFPDGKTVHIPSNGQPLARYEEARAELEARGDNFGYPTAVEVKSKGFFAWLFGGGGEEEGDSEAARDSGGSRPGTPATGRMVASIDRNSVGSVVSEQATANRNDAGMHSFFASSGAPPSEAVAVQPAPAPARRGRGARVQVASLPPAGAEPSEVEAQQRLAQEMQRQEQAKAAAAAQVQAAQARADAKAQAVAEAQAAATAQAQAAETPAVLAAPPAVPAQVAALLPETATRGGAPLPPRRPVEFAASGPGQLPLPPNRPTETAAHTDHAPGAPHDAIAMLAAAAVAGRPALPAVITQGFGQGTGSAPAHILSYAAPSTRPAVVPLPVARPQLVAARLDRSNFRSLTAATPAERSPGHGGLGSSMSALRPAVQTSLGTLGGAAASSQSQGFHVRATDLSTDRFSGTAARPMDRISTAILRKPRPTTDD
jgi:uncharacterized protein YcbK (DUF882 family)